MVLEIIFCLLVLFPFTAAVSIDFNVFILIPFFTDPFRSFSSALNKVDILLYYTIPCKVSVNKKIKAVIMFWIKWLSESIVLMVLKSLKISLGNAGVYRRISIEEQLFCWDAEFKDEGCTFS